MKMRNVAARIDNVRDDGFKTFNFLSQKYWNESTNGMDK